MGRVLVQQPGTNTAKASSETLPKNVIIVDEDLKELRLHDGVTPGGKIIGQNTGSGIPVGTIIPFAGNSVPQGYLLCDGSAISRTDYGLLFAVIGTIYGAGDGNSTFNLPNLTNGYIPTNSDDNVYTANGITRIGIEWGNGGGTTRNGLATFIGTTYNGNPTYTRQRVNTNNTTPYTTNLYSYKGAVGMRYCIKY